MPIVSGFDRVRHSYYDTATIFPGIYKQCLFQTPAGMNGKTLADTNMYYMGMLPHPNIFLAQRIRIELLGSPSGNDVKKVASQYTVTFRICNKAFWEGPFSTLLLHRQIMTALKKYKPNIRQKLEGVLSKGNLALGRLEPSLIHAGENFSVTVYSESQINCVKDFRFRVFLDGYEFRAVQ